MAVQGTSIHCDSTLSQFPDVNLGSESLGLTLCHLHMGAQFQCDCQTDRQIAGLLVINQLLSKWLSVCQCEITDFFAISQPLDKSQLTLQKEVQNEIRTVQA